MEGTKKTCNKSCCRTDRRRDTANKGTKEKNILKGKHKQQMKKNDRHPEKNEWTPVEVRDRCW